jgi:hypothetical protein
LLCCSISFGQKITVTPDGLKDSENLDRSFVVINVEGKKANFIYSEALKYIAKNYKNPDEVTKGKIENEYLKIITHATDFIVIKNSFAKVPISIDYTYELSFKDEKVKFEVIAIDMYDKSGRFKLLFKGEGAFSGYYVYNNKLELKKPEAKTAIGDYFNSSIKSLSDFLNSKDSTDKW